jgi:hypothetical protein
MANCEGTDFGACPLKTAASRQVLGLGGRSLETAVADASERRSRGENHRPRCDAMEMATQAPGKINFGDANGAS